jgi:hypothetical protein
MTNIFIKHSRYWLYHSLIILIYCIIYSFIILLSLFTLSLIQNYQPIRKIVLSFSVPRSHSVFYFTRCSASFTHPDSVASVIPIPPGLWMLHSYLYTFIVTVILLLDTRYSEAVGSAMRLPSVSASVNETGMCARLRPCWISSFASIYILDVVPYHR